MANPLSPLSPLKQNLRSPFGSTTNLNLGALKPGTPLFKSEETFDFTARLDGSPIFHNDENAPMTGGRKSDSMGWTHSPRGGDTFGDDRDDDENAQMTARKSDSMGWTHSPRGDDFGDDREDRHDAEEEPESLEDSMPSSPFQDQVRNELTGAMRDFAPGVNEVRAHEQALEEREDDTRGDVEMAMEEQARPAESEPQNLVDFGNDSSIQLHSDGFGDQSIPVMDPEPSVIHHEQHYRPQQTGFRKVSSMTVDNEGMSAVFQTGTSDEEATGNGVGHSHDVGDDTSHSTFSAVPNTDMTLFAKIRADSPAKRLRESMSPKKVAHPSHLRDSILQTPGSVRSYFGRDNDMDTDSPRGSRSPRRKYPRIDDSMNLLEFTNQVDCPTQTFRPHGGDNGLASPSRRSARGTPMRKSPVKMNLMDFDLTPAQTPRSIPTITPRELETLKASFMSEISSLKATLSGRDAEVASLKGAVTDAERRVGEAMEEVRNEAGRRETFEAEQREWERRGKEMESVLRGIKSEIVERELEKDRLTKRADESDKAKETLEGKLVELESQLSATREAAASVNTSAPSDGDDGRSSNDTAKEVQGAVEKVARELHGLYKSKHETKVAALKKSYEARWEKRIREVEIKLKEAVEENNRLKSELDAVALAAPSAGDATILRETEDLEAQKKMLEAKVKGLEQELLSVKQDSEAVRAELKMERTEKGELVAVVDEWLMMQQDMQEQQLQEEEQQREQEQEQRTPTQPPQRKLSFEPPTPTQPSNPDDDIIRKQEHVREKPNLGPGNSNGSGNGPTVSGIPGAPSQIPSSNIRPRLAPGVTPKVPRFAMPGSQVKKRSSGIEKSNIGRIPGPGRSGIMSNIERMGRGGV